MWYFFCILWLLKFAFNVKFSLFYIFFCWFLIYISNLCSTDFFGIYKLLFIQKAILYIFFELLLNLTIALSLFFIAIFYIIIDSFSSVSICLVLSFTSLFFYVLHLIFLLFRCLQIFNLSPPLIYSYICMYICVTIIYSTYYMFAYKRVLE